MSQSENRVLLKYASQEMIRAEIEGHYPSTKQVEQCLYLQVQKLTKQNDL